ncbi:MAG TPA: hypothetical protein DDY68_00735 [Porphyromonadaceae bacterium]|nr:hypothetical protein [Porphyromonadaceae bacterium]
MKLFDCHTHNLHSSYPALLNWFVNKSIPETKNFLSLGMHPLDLRDGIIPEVLEQMRYCLQTYPQIKAIGEVGLDKRSIYPVQKQCEFLESVLSLAEKYELPVILHCVKCYDQLIALRRCHTSLPLILHGFRGKESLAEMLWNFNFIFSFGSYGEYSTSFLQKSIFFIETDEGKEEMLLSNYSRFSKMSSMSVEELAQRIAQRVKEVFKIELDTQK